MKKALSLTLSALVALSTVASLSGCAGSGDKGMVLNVGAYPDTIDPALNSAVDGGTYIIHAFAGLVTYTQDDSGNIVLTPDCATELPEGVLMEDGKTSYTFTLKDGLKWSDGSDLTAEDFVYAWNRAADPITGADYGYMFEVIDGYADMQDMYKTEEDADGNITFVTAEDGSYEYVDGKKSLNVTASEDGKQLTVVLTVDVPYFHELCAFPTYLPVNKETVEANGDSWATKPETYICNGAYKITSFTQTEIVMEKNEYYHNASAVASDKLTFAFNEDDSSLYANYQNGSYLFIDSVPNDEIEAIAEAYPDEYYVEGQLGTYYISFNVNDAALDGFTDAEKTSIRKALCLMIDRNYIVKEIGKAGQVPAAGFVAMGLTEPDGTEFIDNNGPDGDGSGYYSVKSEDFTKNCEEALALLEEVANSSGKFTVENGKLVNFPTMTYITNEGTGHEAIAEYLQQVWSGYGINLKVETQEWNTFLNTRKNGDYSIARNGWLGDYNDPISFLDMWITDSGNNDCQLGRGDHAEYAAYSYNGTDGLTWAESYDKIIAAVKASSDPEERFALMHEAENILMETGAICPIYYYTDIYMCSSTIDGFFSTPLGFKYFTYASIK